MNKIKHISVISIIAFLMLVQSCNWFTFGKDEGILGYYISEFDIHSFKRTTSSFDSLMTNDSVKYDEIELICSYKFREEIIETGSSFQYKYLDSIIDITITSNNYFSENYAEGTNLIDLFWLTYITKTGLTDTNLNISDFLKNIKSIPHTFYLKTPPDYNDFHCFTFTFKTQNGEIFETNSDTIKILTQK